MPANWQTLGLAVLSILIIIVIRLFIHRSIKKVKAPFVNAPVEFLNASQTKRLILDDFDGYILNMSAKDMQARNMQPRDRPIKNIEINEQYLIKCSNTAIDFSPSEKARCLKAIDAVNKDVAARHQEHFSNPKQAMTKPFAVDWELLNNLPWVIAKTGKMQNRNGNGNLQFANFEYESGLPHTRGSRLHDARVILLSESALSSDDDYLKTTLLHEKIHVYQHKYPHLADIAIKNANYRKTKIRLGDYPDVCANPDIDEWLYIGPKGSPAIMQYNSQNGSTLSARSNGGVVMDHFDQVDEKEHPYEVMCEYLTLAGPRRAGA